MAITFPLTIKFSYEPRAKDCTVVAYNPEFDISSCGQDEAEAKRMLEEAITILLDGAREDGTLDELLSESGFIKRNKELVPPKTYFSTFNYHFA